MAEFRIRVPKDHVELVRRLLISEQEDGPFRTMADVLSFAAALGACRDQFDTVKEGAADPIRIGVFENQGYLGLIDILSLYHTGDANVLSNTDEMQRRRIQVLKVSLMVVLEFLMFNCVVRPIFCNL